MGSCFSYVLAASERTSLCCAATALVCCLVFTIVAVLTLGIGLGYNHCFVDMKTRYKYVPAHYIYPDSPRMESMYMRPNEESLRNLDDDNNIAELSKLMDEVDNAGPMYSSISDTTKNTGQLLEFKSMKRNDAIDYTTKEYPIVSNEDLKSLNLLESVSHSKEKDRNDTKTVLIPITGLKLLDLLSKIKDSNYSLQINYL